MVFDDLDANRDSGFNISEAMFTYDDDLYTKLTVHGISLGLMQGSVLINRPRQEVLSRVLGGYIFCSLGLMVRGPPMRCHIAHPYGYTSRLICFHGRTAAQATIWFS